MAGAFLAKTIPLGPLERVVPRELGPKPWGLETLIADTPYYIGKILRMQAGHRGGLQYHEQKDETFYLLSGAAMLKTAVNGHLRSMRIGPGDCIHVPPGAVHQVEAISECVFFEWSTPHFDDRVNVSAQYYSDPVLGEAW